MLKLWETSVHEIEFRAVTGMPGARTRKTAGEYTVTISFTGSDPPKAKKPKGVCQSGSAALSAI